MIKKTVMFKFFSTLSKTRLQTVHWFYGKDASLKKRMSRHENQLNLNKPNNYQLN